MGPPRGLRVDSCRSLHNLRLAELLAESTTHPDRPRAFPMSDKTTLTKKLSAYHTTTTFGRDPFFDLPNEVRFAILDLLKHDLRTISQLGLSSKAFTHLLQYFFRDLLLIHMPWP